MGMYQYEKRITTIVIALSDIHATKDVLQWLHDNEMEIYGIVSKRGNGRGVQLAIRVCLSINKSVLHPRRLLHASQQTAAALAR